MPRCKNCKDKFDQKYFLQKYCMKKDECIKEAYKSKIQKPIKKVSEKTKKLNATYNKLRKEFIKGKTCPVTNEKATEIHHMKGREYERLNDVKEWLAVSRKGHKWIHENPKQAREKGWLKSK